MRGQPERSAGGRHRCHGHVPLLPVTAAVARTNGPNSGHVFHVATAPQQLSNKPEKLRAAATRTEAEQWLLQATCNFHSTRFAIDYCFCLVLKV